MFTSHAGDRDRPKSLKQVFTHLKRRHFKTRVTVISANCHGLHGFKKRKCILYIFKQLQCNNTCLKDARFASACNIEDV